MNEMVTFKKWLLTCLVLFCSIGLANAQLSGTYTIDPNGSGTKNYTTFGAAITALNNNGVSASVLFEVSADSFNEMITLRKVVGASASKRIVFEGKGMNSTVLWANTANTTVLFTDSAGYFTFRDMTIDDPHTNGTSVQIQNASHNIIVEDCRLTTYFGTTGNILVYLLNGAKNNLFRNNIMKGGYYGVYGQRNNSSYAYPEYNRFEGNSISDNYFAAYIYGNSGDYADSNSFVGNDISNVVNYGLYYYYQEKFEISQNTFHSPSGAYCYAFMHYYARSYQFNDNTVNGYYIGLYAYYGDNINVWRNKIVNSSYAGAYMVYIGQSTTDTSYIVNNMFSSTAAGYPMMLQYLYRTFWYHNSVYATDAYYGMYFYDGANNEFINNSVHMASVMYYPIYQWGSTFSKFDYNNIKMDNWPSGTYPWAYWGNNQYNSYAAWRSGTGYNANGINVDPEYVSASDLHADGLGLNNKGIKLSKVPYDIDMDARPYSPDTLVDIGADEFYVAPNDLDVESIDAPKSLSLTGTNVVKATFRNRGMNSLGSMDVKVAYSFNGGSTWTEDTLNISSLAAGARQSFTFTVPFSISSAGTYSICVRITQQISGDPDAKDEICTNVCDGRSGTIIVDATGNGDHTTIAGAIDELKCGLIGPVTIRIRPGTYNEAISIPEVFGASSVNTITLEGAGRDSVFVVASGNVGVLLNKVSYVTVKNMSIQTATGATGVKITGGSSYNKIQNNKINVGTSTSTNAVGVMIGNSYNTGTNNNNYNLIENNQILGGYFGATSSGASSAVGGRVIGNQFVKNVIENQYYYGMYLYYNQGLIVRGNVLNGATTATGSYGMNPYYNNNSRYEDNVIKNYGYSPMMWYYENYTNASSTDTTWFVNNMISSDPNKLAYGYGFYAVYPTRVKFYHNSISYPKDQYYGMMFQYGSMDMRNNIFQQSVTAHSSYYSLYFINVTWLGFDYNNFDFQSGSRTYYNGTIYGDVKSWLQSVTQYNQNSTTVPANFVSSINDLHISFTQPFPSGTPLGIGEDIDGDTRCATAPTMGADESRYPVPPPVANFLAPDTAWINAGTTFYNSAGATENFSYKWYVNGTMMGSSLHMNNTFTSAGSYQVKLVTEGCSGTDSITKTVVVSAPTRKPAADFLADKTEGVVWESIQLTDLSTNGASSWEWIITPEDIYDPDFGFTVATYFYMSGDQYSQNPVIAFEYPGKYDVCLVATNSMGSDTLCYSEYITVLGTASMCFFPFETNNTEGILYDDGGPMGNYSAGKNGINQCYYVINSCAGDVELSIEEFTLNTGDYLRVFDGNNNKGTPLWDVANFPKGMNGNLSNASVRTKVTATSGRMYIEFESDASTGTVGPGFKAIWRTIPRNFASPVAAFTAPDTVCIDIPVEFRNSSTGSNVSYQWDVNADSSFESTSSSYMHTFKAAGTYAVKLHVANCGGIDTITKWVVAETVSRTPSPDFTVSNNKPALGDVVNFTNTTSYCVTNYKWAITPGNHFYANQTTDASMHPDVVFTAPGYYNVKLVATNPQGSDSIIKQQVIFVINYCKPAVVNLNNELGISRVTLSTLNGNTLLDNPSKIGEAGYTNYTTTHSATLAQGSRYIVRLERNIISNPMNRAVWIDLNRDGDFDDAGELVASESSAMTMMWSDTIHIPLNAAGGATRMRVGTNRGTNNNLPCGPNMFGEYEDYAIILVPDQQGPVITLIGNDTLYMQQCVAYTEMGATAYDDVDGDISGQIMITNNVDSSVTGAHTVWYDVTDQSGNKATRVVRTVIVEADTMPAVIALAGNNPDTIEVNTPYTEPGYTAMDMCDGNITSQVTVAGTVIDTITGIYTINYSVTDASNNTTTVSRRVVVADRTLPVIALNGSATITIDVNTTYTDPWVTVSDNYDKSLNVQVTGAVDTSVAGTYILEYCVTDSEGNGPVCVTRTVKVEDTQAPVVTLTDGSSISWEVNVPFVDPGYTVVDNSNGHIDVTVTGTVNVKVLGTYTLTYTFTDPSNNSTQLTRSVQVVDIRAPIISLKGPLVDTVYRWRAYNEPGFDLSDNYYSNAQLTITYGGSFEQNGTLLEGTYTRTYQAEDPSGNKSAILQRVIVVVLDTTTGINEPGKPEVKVYPNPASNGLFTVSVNVPEGNSRTRISITNMMGAEIMILDEGSINADRVYPVDMGNAAAGVYFVRVASESHVTIKKVVIVR